MREYAAAVKQADPTVEVAGEVKFPVVKMSEDGTTVLERRWITAVPPDDGQFGYLLMGVNRRAPMREQVATAINFLMAVLPHNEDAQYLADRLLDGKDSFGISDVRDILEDLVEEWSGRPTQSPSDSASSEPHGGSPSTAVTPMSTSSGSPSIVI